MTITPSTLALTLPPPSSRTHEAADIQNIQSVINRWSRSF
jgi:hypothetical protein